MGKSTALKGEARKQFSLAALGIQIPEERMLARQKAEQARTMLRGELGKPGTYDQAAAPTGVGQVPDLFEDVGVLGGTKVMSGADKKKILGRQLVSPEALVEYQKGTPEFQIMSRLTAEAGQMLKKEGPLWDELHQSVVSPIIEGSAALLADQAEQLRRDYARGGMRRSQARESIVKMQMQEAANLQRTHQVWNANLALHQWSRNFANQQVTEYNKAFTDNAGGIRDSFNDALDNIGQWYVSTAIPQMSSVSSKGLGFHMQAKAADQAKKGGILKMVAGIGMAVGGALIPGASAFVAPGLQMAVGGMLGEETAGSMLGGAAGEQAGQLFGSAARWGGRSIAGILGMEGPEYWQPTATGGGTSPESLMEPVNLRTKLGL